MTRQEHELRTAHGIFIWSMAGLLAWSALAIVLLTIPAETTNPPTQAAQAQNNPRAQANHGNPAPTSRIN